jgi:hypothetical protein
MKQTAVEWLVEELQKAEYIPKDSVLMDYVINTAKEKEKEDLEEAFRVGFNVGYNDSESPSYLTFEKWFKQFKNK